MAERDQTRTYSRKDSVVFLKTDEPFGGLSNMAGGYPIHVNGVRILTSEALYQVCRFPHLPDVQKLIIGQVSPMTAKMRSKPYRKDSRPDWDQVRVRIMRWSLRMKLANNWNTFSALLLKTGDRCGQVFGWVAGATEGCSASQSGVSWKASAEERFHFAP